MNLQYQKPRDEAMEKIEDYIIKNRLQPGDKLPSERTMCEMWDINRSTLRSAIKQLIVDGRIYNKNNAGTYLAKPKLTRNLQDAKGLQQAAEAVGRVVTSQVITCCLVEAPKEIGKKMKLKLGHKLLCLKRIRFLDDIPVMLSTVYIDAERFPGLEGADFLTQSLYHTIQERYGVEVKSGREKLSIAYCNEEEAKYLQVEEGMPVIFQTGVTLDEKNKIFECFKEITLNKYVRFASELTRM